VACNPQGSGVGSDTGGCYYSPAEGAGIYIFTDEFSFHACSLCIVQWNSRNSGCNPGGNTCSADDAERSKMRLALRMGDTWYISDEGIEHTAGEIAQRVKDGVEGIPN
jgi:hypothetical protein